MDEHLTHDELKERIRNGSMFSPSTPGLQAAAREVIRPIIEGMRGGEVIYRFRVPWLVRIDKLRVDDERFEAVATPIQEIPDSIFSIQLDSPFDFSAKWICLHLVGSAICMAMITDHFYPDPAVVTEIKDAAARKADPNEIAEILARASERK